MLLGSRFSARLVLDIYSPGTAGFGGPASVGSGMGGLRALLAPRAPSHTSSQHRCLGQLAGEHQIGAGEQTAMDIWCEGNAIPACVSHAEVCKKPTQSLLLGRVKERGSYLNLATPVLGVKNELGQLGSSFWPGAAPGAGLVWSSAACEAVGSAEWELGIGALSALPRDRAPLLLPL